MWAALRAPTVALCAGWQSMSEYQYYEFLAIDRPLTPAEMRVLRSYSTRARITPTGFVNEYNWGSFKGDIDDWMEKYFDAFLYLANWGTRIFMARLPSGTLDLLAARPYCPGGSAAVREKDGRTILTFRSENEAGDDFAEEDGWLASLALTRAGLSRGDHRALYLGWLLCAQNDELPDAEPEPPVPPGLGALDAPLEGLAGFLRIDPHLIHVAAEDSEPWNSPEPSREKLARWIDGLSPVEKDGYLLRLLERNEPHLAGELLQRFHREHGEPAGRRAGGAPARTVGALLQAAEAYAEEQRRLAAIQAAEEEAQRRQQAIRIRQAYLRTIEGKEEVLWRQVEGLIATRQGARYRDAVQLLVDLHDLALRKGEEAAFGDRIYGLRERHDRKAGLLRRLEQAGLFRPVRPDPPPPA